MSMRCFSWVSFRRRRFDLVSCWLATVLIGGLADARGTAAEPGANLGRKEFLAAVLAKVPPYVHWPESAFAAPGDPLVIGLLGEDPTEGLLASLVQGLRVGEREVVVRSFATAPQVGKCQILFVPATRGAEWESVSKSADPHVLVVGENEEVEKLGGVMSASPQDRKLHVFLANARKAQLDIDARLLKIAKVHR